MGSPPIAEPRLVERLTRWIMQSGWVKSYEHARAEAEGFLAGVDVGARIDSAFDQAMRRYVSSPEAGGDGVDVAIADALNMARAAVLAFALPEPLSLRAAVERYDALGGFAIGHTAHGPTDAQGYCRSCDQTMPYDGWHERADAAAAIRRALGSEVDEERAALHLLREGAEHAGPDGSDGSRAWSHKWWQDAAVAFLALTPAQRVARARLLPPRIQADLREVLSRALLNGKFSPHQWFNPELTEPTLIQTRSYTDAATDLAAFIERSGR